MLDSPRNAAGHVKVGGDLGSSQPYLPLLVHPALVYGPPRAAHLTAQNLGQLLHQGETLGVPHAPAAGDNDLGLAQRHLRTDLLADHLQHLASDLEAINVYGDGLYFSSPTGIGQGRTESAGQDGRHLRSGFGADAGLEVLAAVDRIGGQQLTLHLVNLKAQTVGEESRPQALSQARGQVTAHAGGPQEDDLWLPLFNEIAQHLAVDFGAVLTQTRIIGHVDHIGTVGDEFLPELLRALSQEDGLDVDAQAIGQLTSLAQHLQDHRGQGVAFFLSHHPDIAVGALLLHFAHHAF